MKQKSPAEAANAPWLTRHDVLEGAAEMSCVTPKSSKQQSPASQQRLRRPYASARGIFEGVPALSKMGASRRAQSVGRGAAGDQVSCQKPSRSAACERSVVTIKRMTTAQSSCSYTRASQSKFSRIVYQNRIHARRRWFEKEDHPGCCSPVNYPLYCWSLITIGSALSAVNISNRIHFRAN